MSRKNLNALPALSAPPYSAEDEIGVLSCMLKGREATADVLVLLDEDCFYLPLHQKLFVVIKKLFQENREYDLTLLTDLLVEGTSEGRDFIFKELINIAGWVITAHALNHYAERVRDKATQRRLLKIGAEIQERAADPLVDVPEFLADAEKQIFAIREKRRTKDFLKIGDILAKTIERLDILAREGYDATVVKTHFPDLDRLIGGLQNGDLVILAGRTSTGKTAFALNLAANASRGPAGVPVGIFSLEMGAEQITQRMIAMEKKVNLHAMRTGRLEPEDWIKVTDMTNEYYHTPIIIDDTSGLAISDLSIRARRMKQRENIGLLIVDYLQLISTGRRDTREQEVALVSRTLKNVARELEIPVVALSQLSRAVDHRIDQRPRLSDLRESGALEQDADIVAFIYRPGLIKPDDEFSPKKSNKTPIDPRTAVILVEKHRHGPTGEVMLWFDPHYMQFKSQERAHRQF